MELPQQLEKQQLVGVLLTSMGALALEVVLTRIFSVTMWYHFAFLAISLALLGSGAAGVMPYAFQGLAEPRTARRWIGRLAILFAVSARRRRSGEAPPRPSAALLGYFAALGLASMLIEIPTIQKFTVYLGRPVYSLAVVLSALLFSSGPGSLSASRWSQDQLSGRIRWPFAVLFAVVLLHPFVSKAVLSATLGWAVGPRMAVAVVLIGALGFLMGVPFSTGIRWVGVHQAGVVPWLWAINGVMSVLGSAPATATAIHLGLRITAVLAAAIYGAAGVLLAVELSPAREHRLRLVSRRRRGPAGA